MPVTPFHFGPGVLFKATVPKGFSLATFLLTEVAVDVEVLYHLQRQEWPTHAAFHTLPGALVAGGTAAAFIAAAGRLWPGLRRSVGAITQLPPDWVRGEFSLAGCVSGGMLGALSASLLDAIMHADVQPFAPFYGVNPFLGIIGIGLLHTACVGAGLLGLVLLLLRIPRQRAAG